MVQPQIQTLDRLVSKTELTPASKQLLRKVRKAVMTGNASSPVIGNYSWTIEVATIDGQPVRMSFKMRRNG